MFARPLLVLLLLLLSGCRTASAGAPVELVAEERRMGTLFRFRVWTKTYREAPYFGGDGQLSFDAASGKFRAYYGVFDGIRATALTLRQPRGALVALQRMARAHRASKRFRHSHIGTTSPLPDRLRVH